MADNTLSWRYSTDKNSVSPRPGSGDKDIWADFDAVIDMRRNAMCLTKQKMQAPKNGSSNDDEIKGKGSRSATTPAGSVSMLDSEIAPNCGIIRGDNAFGTEKRFYEPAVSVNTGDIGMTLIGMESGTMASDDQNANVNSVSNQKESIALKVSVKPTENDFHVGQSAKGSSQSLDLVREFSTSTLAEVSEDESSQTLDLTRVSNPSTVAEVSGDESYQSMDLTRESSSTVAEVSEDESSQSMDLTRESSSSSVAEVSEDESSSSLASSNQDDIRSLRLTSPQVEDWLNGTPDEEEYISMVDQASHRQRPLYCHSPSLPVEGLITRPTIRQPDRIRREDLTNYNPNRSADINSSGSQPFYRPDVERPRSSAARLPSQIPHQFCLGAARPGTSMESRESLRPQRANVLITDLGQRANQMRRHRPRGAAMSCIMETSENMVGRMAGTNERSTAETADSRTNAYSSDSVSDWELQSFGSFCSSAEQPGSPRAIESESSVSRLCSPAEQTDRSRAVEGDVKIYDLEELEYSPRISEPEDTNSPHNFTHCAMESTANDSKPKKNGRLRRVFVRLQRGLRRASRRLLDLVTACSSS